MLNDRSRQRDPELADRLVSMLLSRIQRWWCRVTAFLAVLAGFLGSTCRPNRGRGPDRLRRALR